MRNRFYRVDKQNWFKFRDPNNSRATRATVLVTGDQQQSREKVLFKESVRLETRKNFFLVRVVDRWNRIPDAVKAQKMINAFKNSYHQWC